MWQIEPEIKRSNLGIFRYRADRATNPRNGYQLEVSIIESPDAAQIVAENSKGDLLLVQQYRFGIGKMTLELPGGHIDPGELPLPAAQRELQEETGYTSSEWIALGKIPSNPVFMESYIHHFYAKDISLTHELSLDLGEDIFLAWHSVDSVKEMLLAGEFQHPHTVAALVAYFAHTSKLTI